MEQDFDHEKSSESEEILLSNFKYENLSEPNETFLDDLEGDNFSESNEIFLCDQITKKENINTININQTLLVTTEHSNNYNNEDKNEKEILVHSNDYVKQTITDEEKSKELERIEHEKYLIQLIMEQPILDPKQKKANVQKVSNIIHNESGKDKQQFKDILDKISLSKINTLPTLSHILIMGMNQPDANLNDNHKNQIDGLNSNKIKDIMMERKMDTDKELSENSIMNYNSRIKQLKNCGLDVDNIPSINVILEILEKKGYALSTKSGMLTAIIKYSKKYKVNESILSALNDELTRVEKTIKSIVNKNEMTDKNKLNYVSWETLQEIHKRLNSLKDLQYPNKDIDLSYLILSFYTLMPPRRLIDFVKLHYDNSQKIDLNKVITYCNIDHDINIQNEDTNELHENDTKNYYVDCGNKGYFIFNNYKTKYKYDTQYLELNTELHNILKNYIATHNVKQGDNIVNVSYTTYKVILNDIIKLYTNKNITIDSLRHIYITHNLDNKIVYSINEREHMATQMAHSLSMQEKYKKKIEPELLDNTINNVNVGDIAIKRKRGRKPKYTTSEQKMETSKRNQTKSNETRAKKNLIKKIDKQKQKAS